jgi:putative N6-adenine-specific DNA methylase
MVFNPPYDERLDIHMEEFYKNIGDTLKKNYPGTNAWFITGNLEALKFVGLKPSRKIKLFNASIEARLVKYEMYEGSKRTKFQTQESDSIPQTAVIRSSKTKNTVSKIKIIIDYKTHNSSLFQGGWIINF